MDSLTPGCQKVSVVGLGPPDCPMRRNRLMQILILGLFLYWFELHAKNNTNKSGQKPPASGFLPN
jgi:hypothetical protein